MSAVDIALAGVRAIHVALVLPAFGVPAFGVILADRTGNSALIARLHRIAGRAALLGALMALPWLLLQAAVFAGATSPGAALAALPATLGTRFGHVLLPQFLLLLAAFLVLRRAGDARTSRLALLLSGLALGAHALVGHLAVEIDARSLPFLAAQLGHLLAAGTWLGGMIGLLLAARILPVAALARVSHGFSPLGVACVAVLAFSAGLNGYALIGGLGALLGTFYGWLAVGKAGLFLLMLALAARNRWVITPRLAAGADDQRRLVRSVGVELLLGLLVVALAAGLASSVPGVHDQPWWPWSRRWSAAMLSDPDLGGDARRALALSVGGLLLLAMALLPCPWPRLCFRLTSWPGRALRLAVLAGGGAALWQGAPDLDLLTVEAFPTSFWSSPSGFTTASIAQGAALFPQHCAACHGAGGAGDGPRAAQLTVPPADLTAGHLLDHSDGDVYWWLSHGMPDPDGNRVMPGFAEILSDDDRWSLIDYIHARNSGANLADSGNRWTRPMPAPEVALTCPDSGAGSLADLAGHPVLLAVGQDPATLSADVLTVLRRERVVPVLTVNSDAPPAGNVCVGLSSEATVAYQTITGLSAPLLVLIDGQGALRQAWTGGLPASATALSPLLDSARDAQAHPFAARTGGHHHH